MITVKLVSHTFGPGLPASSDILPRLSDVISRQAKVEPQIYANERGRCQISGAAQNLAGEMNVRTTVSRD